MIPRSPHFVPSPPPETAAPPPPPEDLPPPPPPGLDVPPPPPPAEVKKKKAGWGTPSPRQPLSIEDILKKKRDADEAAAKVRSSTLKSTKTPYSPCIYLVPLALVLIRVFLLAQVSVKISEGETGS